MGVLSKEGVCKVFDQDAEGYVKGESVGCIFLQKAKDSKRIYAQVSHRKHLPSSKSLLEGRALQIKL